MLILIASSIAPSPRFLMVDLEPDQTATARKARNPLFSALACASCIALRGLLPLLRIARPGGIAALLCWIRTQVDGLGLPLELGFFQLLLPALRENELFRTQY